MFVLSLKLKIVYLKFSCILNYYIVKFIDHFRGSRITAYLLIDLHVKMIRNLILSTCLSVSLPHFHSCIFCSFHQYGFAKFSYCGSILRSSQLLLLLHLPHNLILNVKIVKNDLKIVMWLQNLIHWKRCIYISVYSLFFSHAISFNRNH